MSLQECLSVTRERWRWIAGGLIVGLLAAIAATWATTPVYASTVSLYVSAPTETGGLDQALAGSTLAAQKIRSYPRLLISDRVREDVQQVVGFPIAPEQTSALIEPDSTIITATVTDASPARAKRIADVTAAEFSELVSELERVPEDARRAVVIAQIIKPAVVAPVPVSPRQTSNLLLGGALGLVAGIGAALLRNTIDRTVRSGAAVGRLLAAPILGTVALNRRQRRHKFLLTEHPRAAATEAFRQIATQLRAHDEAGGFRRIVVTSARSGEGRTTVACNLALVLGQSGNRVLVIDADLRAPKVAERLGLRDAQGLSDVLSGAAQLGDAVQALDPTVDVLTAGTIPANPGALVGSPSARALLDAVAERYDVVIIDTPPALPFGDASALAARADATVLVVRLGRATEDQVRDAVAVLEPMPAPVVGVVVNSHRKVRGRKLPAQQQPAVDVPAAPQIVQPFREDAATEVLPTDLTVPAPVATRDAMVSAALVREPTVSAMAAREPAVPETVVPDPVVPEPVVSEANLPVPTSAPEPAPPLSILAVRHPSPPSPSPRPRPVPAGSVEAAQGHPETNGSAPAPTAHP